MLAQMFDTRSKEVVTREYHPPRQVTKLDAWYKKAKETFKLDDAGFFRISEEATRDWVVFKLRNAEEHRISIVIRRTTGASPLTRPVVG